MIDSEDEEPPDDPPEQSIEDEQHDDAPADDQAVSASPQQPPVAVAPRRIADMRTVMRKVGGPDYEEILRELDDHLGPGNHVFPSERCGGDARRLLLKRKASQMSRSLSKTFAYLTSKTASAQRATDVLQTFGNVC